MFYLYSYPQELQVTIIEYEVVKNHRYDYYLMCGMHIYYLDLKQITFFSSGFGGPVAHVKNIQIVVNSNLVKTLKL